MTLRHFLPIYIFFSSLFQFFSSRLVVPPKSLGRVLLFQCADIMLIIMHVLLVARATLWKQKICMRVVWVIRDWCSALIAFQFWAWLWSSWFMLQCDLWMHLWKLRVLWWDFRCVRRRPWGEAGLMRKKHWSVCRRGKAFFARSLNIQLLSTILISTALRVFAYEQNILIKWGFFEFVAIFFV